jgi:hypothetical protein
MSFRDNIKKEERETILKKLKNGKAPREEYSELYIYALKKLRIEILK